MLNVSMLQLTEHFQRKHKHFDESAVSFERIEESLSAVENNIDDLLGNEYEVRPRYARTGERRAREGGHGGG